MTTLVQEINERHLRGGIRRPEAKKGSALDVAADLGLFLVAPFVGLAFAAAYGFVGLAVIVCYGLKAFGVECGLFSR